MSHTNRIFISNLLTVSALGFGTGQSLVSRIPEVSGASERWGFPVFALPPEVDEEVVSSTLRGPKDLDRVSYLALYLAERLSPLCAENSSALGGKSLGVSIGSSRGPTSTLEDTHVAFTRKWGDSACGFRRGSVALPPYTSPSTTFGNISAWVAQRLLTEMGGTANNSPTEVFSHSISMTCSSAFHTLISGVAFLKSGMVDGWVFGGSEAPLTPYTLAQMDVLRVYTRYDTEWPCRPRVQLDPTGSESDRSSLTLGEGAGIAVATVNENAPASYDFELLGMGWAIEKVPSSTGISEDGRAFAEAMHGALKGIDRDSIYCVVAHAPGTVKGDAAEMAAIKSIFGERPMPITSCKHLTGHTFGAAGMLSLEWARQITCTPQLLGPCTSIERSKIGVTGVPRRFLINAGGFGGNSVSLCVEARAFSQRS